MARCKNHKRPRRTNNLRNTPQKSCEKTSSLTTNMVSNEVTEDIDLDSTLETSVSSSDTSHRSPESLLCALNRQASPYYCTDLSPEVVARVLPKIKFNLDVHEDDWAKDATTSRAIAENYRLEGNAGENKSEQLENSLDKGFNSRRWLDDLRQPNVPSKCNSSYGIESRNVSFGTSTAPAEIKGRRLNFNNAQSTSRTSLARRSESCESHQSESTYHTFQSGPSEAGKMSIYSGSSYWHAPIDLNSERLRKLKDNLGLEMFNGSIIPIETSSDAELREPYDFDSRNNSPPAKRSCTASGVGRSNRLELPSASEFYLTRPEPTLAIKVENDDVHPGTRSKGWWNDWWSSKASVELPTSSNPESKDGENDSRVSSFRARLLRVRCTTSIRIPSIPRWQELVPPLPRISEFCTWFFRKIIHLIKKGYSRVLHALPSATLESPRTSPLPNELAHVIEVIRFENEHTVSVLKERLTHLSKELTQARVTSETTLAALANEVSGMRAVSNQLYGSNSTLAEELKALHKTLKTMRCEQPLAPSPPPPPPPPPPPLPPSTSLSLPNTPTTSSSSSRSIRTPIRKYSTPINNRPSITVEDLLKVTLKKAPHNAKATEESNAANSVPKIAGPVVSLDMLRSVKLKPARRRSNERNVSLSRSRSIKNGPPPTSSLSPITAGTENPLSRILRQVETERRRSKGRLSSTVHSEKNFSKSPQRFGKMRQSKSHGVLMDGTNI